MSEVQEAFGWEMLRLGARGIRRRPWRAALTFLTIMLAIGCVVSTVAVIGGASSQISEDIRGFGAHCVNIYSPDIFEAMSFGIERKKFAPLTQELAGTLEERIEGAHAAPVRFQLGSVRGAASTRLAPMVATTPEFEGTFDSRLIGGRFLAPEDLEERRPVCALDRALAVDLLTASEAKSDTKSARAPDPMGMIGEHVTVRLGGEDVALEVVGIFEDPISLREQLNALDNGSARLPLARLLAFKNLYLPITWLAADETTPLQAIYLDLSDAPDLGEAASRVKPVLEALGHPDAGVVLRRDWIEGAVSSIREFSTLGNITWVVTLLVALVMTATISLVAIRERLPEVALRRVEGARRRDIVMQFVSESVLVSAAAGAAGIGVGVLATRVLLATVLPWEPKITLGSFVLSALLSVAVGVLATVLPAYRATKLDPIHYLRDT
ncbi:MAG: ABC transporter permease [Planctomycetota bacterium]